MGAVREGRKHDDSSRVHLPPSRAWSSANLPETAVASYHEMNWAKHRGHPTTLRPKGFSTFDNRLLGHGFAGAHALLASLSTLLAAGHIAALQALGSTVLARLRTQLTHRPRQRSLILHQSNARPACLQAGQAVLLAVGAITTDEALPAGTQALVASLDAVFLEYGNQFRFGSDGRLRNGKRP